jgi:ribonuclease HI
VYSPSHMCLGEKKHMGNTSQGTKLNTNNRAELIGLWNLLEAAKENDIQRLRVFVDSKMVIDWAMNKINIQNIRLEPIMREIRETFNSFSWLSFHHILRELNSKADKLSKDAVLLNPGTFSLYEFHDGVETEAMEVRL